MKKFLLSTVGLVALGMAAPASAAAPGGSPARAGFPRSGACGGRVGVERLDTHQHVPLVRSRSQSRCARRGHFLKLL
jgi:hypothetical protein